MTEAVQDLIARLRDGYHHGETIILGSVAHDSRCLEAADWITAALAREAGLRTERDNAVSADKTSHGLMRLVMDKSADAFVRCDEQLAEIERLREALVVIGQAKGTTNSAVNLQTIWNLTERARAALSVQP